MAKSPGFFSKRTGSAGDLTFSVLNGKQITKQKISKMSNPQSAKQADQRARVLPAQRFLAEFETVLNHSIEGIRPGYLTKQAFLKKAMKVTPVCPMYKGQLGFMPENYEVSKGSLPTLGYKITDTLAFAAASDNVVGYTATGGTAAEYLASFLANNGWEMGDQITFLGVQTYGGYDSTKTRVFIDRIIFDENVSQAGDDITSENGYMTIDISDGTLSRQNVPANVQLVGLAVIRTHADAEAGKFRYSTEIMDVLESWITEGSSDMLPARQSYMKGATALESDRYLQQAEDVQEAEITYSSPRAYAGNATDFSTAGNLVGLIVYGSDEKWHAVESTRGGYGSQTASGTDVILVPGIQSFGVAYGPESSEGDTVYVESHNLKWADDTQVTQAGAEAVVLGAPVQYADVVNLLINA